MTIFSKGRKGFSLVEVLIAAGLASGLALVVAQVLSSSSKTQKNIESKTEISAGMDRIRSVMQSSISCNLNLKGKPAASNITDIRYCDNADPINLTCNTAGVPMIAIADRFGDYEVTSIQTELVSAGTIALNVKFNHVNSSVSKHGLKELNRTMLVQAQVTAGTIQNCFSDVSNAIDTAVINGCKGNSAELIGLPGGGFECHHNTDNTINCGPGEFLDQVTTPSGMVKLVCDKISNNVTACPTGEYAKGVATDGNLICVPISCPTGQIGLLSSSGNIECINSCNNGNVLIKTTSGWKCTNTMCTDGGGNGIQQYLVGFDPNGNKICNTLVDATNTECKTGSKMVANNDGSIKLVCCTPQCSPSSTNAYCPEDWSPGSNGCGMCPGTKPSQPGNFDSYGTITSPGWSGPSVVTDSQWNDKWYMCGKYNTASNPTARTVTRTTKCNEPVCAGARNCSGNRIESKICTFEYSPWVKITSSGSWNRTLTQPVAQSSAQYLILGGGGGGAGSSKGNYNRGRGGYKSNKVQGTYNIADSTSCEGVVGLGGLGGGLGSHGQSGAYTTFKCVSSSGAYLIKASFGGGGGDSTDAGVGNGSGDPKTTELIRYDASDLGFSRIGGTENCRNSGNAGTTPGVGGGGGCSDRQQRKSGAKGGDGYVQFRYWQVQSFQ